jgi:hypothetical protein
MDALRGLVSKKKVRYQEDGFDLDLTYITPRIIGEPCAGRRETWVTRSSSAFDHPALTFSHRRSHSVRSPLFPPAAMGAPSEGNEGLYRNPMVEVQRFFELKHEGEWTKQIRLRSSTRWGGPVPPSALPLSPHLLNPPSHLSPFPPFRPIGRPLQDLRPPRGEGRQLRPRQVPRPCCRVPFLRPQPCPPQAHQGESAS